MADRTLCDDKSTTQRRENRSCKASERGWERTSQGAPVLDIDDDGDEAARETRIPRCLLGLSV